MAITAGQLSLFEPETCSSSLNVRATHSRRKRDIRPGLPDALSAQPPRRVAAATRRSANLGDADDPLLVLAVISTGSRRLSAVRRTGSTSARHETTGCDDSRRDDGARALSPPTASRSTTYSTGAPSTAATSSRRQRSSTIWPSTSGARDRHPRRTTAASGCCAASFVGSAGAAVCPIRSLSWSRRRSRSRRPTG